MVELKSEIVQHLAEGVRNGPRAGGAQPEVVRYLEARYASSPRVQCKRLCRKVREATGEGDRDAACCELAVFLMQMLVGNNGIIPRQVSTAVAVGPFLGAVSQGSGGRGKGGKARSRDLTPAQAKRMLRQVLKRIEDQDLDAKDIDESALLGLASALVETSERNKNFNVCQRLMELKEDLLLEKRGIAADGKPGRCHAHDGELDDCEKYARFFQREKVSTANARAYYGVGSDAESVAWWAEFVKSPSITRLSELIACSLFIAGAEFTKNLESNRTQNLPIDLVDLYLADRSDQGYSMRPNREEDVLQLLVGMNEARYGRAVIPLALDPRTGGGLYLMGRERLEQHCPPSSLEELPDVACAPLLVDYHMGNPLGGAADGRRMGVIHACYVQLPPIYVSDVQCTVAKEEWRLSLKGLRSSFEERAQRMGARGAQGTFWDSFFQSNGCEESELPEDCPESFRAYFQPKTTMATHGLRLEDFPASASETQRAIVPKCLVRYLQEERGEQLDARVYDDNEVIRGADQMEFERVKAYALKNMLGYAGSADYVPYVVEGSRTQEDWNNIFEAALRLDDFKRYYLAYLVQAGIVREDARQKACHWLEVGRIDEGRLAIGRMARRFFDQGNRPGE